MHYPENPSDHTIVKLMYSNNEKHQFEKEADTRQFEFRNSKNQIEIG